MANALMEQGNEHKALTYLRDFYIEVNERHDIDWMPWDEEVTAKLEKEKERLGYSHCTLVVS